MQGESRSQVYLDYAEPPPIFVQASAIELAHIAERSRKCQEKVHLYEEKKKDVRRMDTHPYFL